MYNIERLKTEKVRQHFVVEGYDESFEFRIFDEEYLKFRHFLLQNQFAYFKITVKEGWVNRETGKNPIQEFSLLDVKMLADVLPTFAKNSLLQLAINDVKEGVISELNQIFTQHKGDHNVTFEVMELEKIKRMVEEKPVAMISTDTEDEMEENLMKWKKWISLFQQKKRRNCSKKLSW